VRILWPDPLSFLKARVWDVDIGWLEVRLLRSIDHWLVSAFDSELIRLKVEKSSVLKRLWLCPQKHHSFLLQLDDLRVFDLLRSLLVQSLLEILRKESVDKCARFAFRGMGAFKRIIDRES